MAAKGSKGGKKVEAYKQCFKELDKNGDGYVDACELKEMMKKQGCTMDERQLKETFEFFEGKGGDEKITFEEFSRAMDSLMTFLEDVMSLFIALDADQSGYLERNELKTLLKNMSEKGKNFSEADIDKILKAADVNGDNKISPDEFLNVLC